MLGQLYDITDTVKEGAAKEKLSTLNSPLTTTPKKTVCGHYSQTKIWQWQVRPEGV